MEHTLFIKVKGLTPRRRANLTQLADYLESLPHDYAHFNMSEFYDHRGGCELIDDPDLSHALKILSEKEGETIDETESHHLYATSIEEFLANCGTVACALGHGPAAGIPLAKTHIETTKVLGKTFVTRVDFDKYAKNFVRGDHYGNDWEWLFSATWERVDNHHWGAAARIRFLLDKKGIPAQESYWGFPGHLEMIPHRNALPLYEPYRVDVRPA